MVKSIGEIKRSMECCYGECNQKKCESCAYNDLKDNPNCKDVMILDLYEYLCDVEKQYERIFGLLQRQTEALQADKDIKATKIEKRIMGALQRAAVMIGFAAIVMVGIAILSVSCFNENGWILLWLLPLVGAGTFMVCLNPFGWFD